MSERQIRKIKIEWKPKKSRISQVYSEGLEYAFVTKDNRQIHQMVYCKDFLQDAIYALLNNKYIEIYNFIYSPANDLPLSMNTTRIILSNYKDKNFRTKIPSCVEFINQVETHLKMKKTEVFEGLDAPAIYRKAGIWLFQGSKRWMQSAPLISMYTLLLRTGLMHQRGTSWRKTVYGILDDQVNPYQIYDKKQLADAMPGINHIMQYGDRKLFGGDIKNNYPARIPISEIHNRFGIVGFSEGLPKYEMPKWYKMGEPAKANYDQSAFG
jgi:gamma-glutamylcyclotransferase (GGCT)/AIG2-like uncharacterized protein YtfP